MNITLTQLYYSFLLIQLSQITKCLQSGDVGTMKAIMDANQDLIIKRGLFVIVYGGIDYSWL